jgi:hypothetical protein
MGVISTGREPRVERRKARAGAWSTIATVALGVPLASSASNPGRRGGMVGPIRPGRRSRGPPCDDQGHLRANFDRGRRKRQEAHGVRVSADRAAQGVAHCHHGGGERLDPNVEAGDAAVDADAARRGSRGPSPEAAEEGESNEAPVACDVPASRDRDASVVAARSRPLPSMAGEGETAKLPRTRKAVCGWGASGAQHVSSTATRWQLQMLGARRRPLPGGAGEG